MTKVLIIHPDLQRLGGIEAYYQKITPYFSRKPEFFAIARRPGEKGMIQRLFRIVNDYKNCWIKISDPSIDLVFLNPSLEPKSFLREGVFLLMAKLRRKRVLVFFHGWNLEFQSSIDRKMKWLFRALYGKADAFIVLASSFADSLRRWGIKQPVYKEVMVIDDSVINNFNFEETVKKRLANSSWQLLFVSRLMPAKGLFTAIKALKIAQQAYPQIGLVVAGDGESANEARQLAQSLEVKNIHFRGAVMGDEKYKLFHLSHALLFPTEHAEGFPNVIVEAMAFGLPVITRHTGGINDFFVSGTHGYITESTSPDVFAQFIVRTIDDPGLYLQMSQNNHRYAKDHFLVSNAAQRLENIYASILSDSSSG